MRYTTVLICDAWTADLLAPQSLNPCKIYEGNQGESACALGGARVTVAALKSRGLAIQKPTLTLLASYVD